MDEDRNNDALMGEEELEPKEETLDEADLDADLLAEDDADEVEEDDEFDSGSDE